ncbi:ABC transporter ATP-binding protein [Aestuariivirga litoralis]|uniref:ABC transporter ATP-binding protein n=1 Tax=Aestuariivirga litoralis TaxID=2650924 RepID=A0A2W2AJQ1_9HYPH|nr:sn-glycerol-3-phosphate ABC transporter ATP-binding protein UgpC [Aestuariivirga litoralis]PZF75705.1 ABC transporter ATP-binding protein [Aestuariivirga litoralis]
MAEVLIENLKKSFGSVEVLKDIDLTVEDGGFVVLVGPSGCGKSTLLRAIAGLEPVSGGTITIGGRKVNDLAPAQREIAMVFQSYALYPHMDVAANMGFGLKFAGTPKAEIEARVAEAARILQLEPLLKRRPRELSGGQRQRVAIGRAIVRKPQVFLFDEPLSNLDAALRINTRVEIARLHKLLAATIVYVTHDQVEAMTLADKIVVMNQGRIEQQGKPLDLYYRPANLFVAGFIGSPAMNFLKGQVVAAGVDLGVDGRLAVPLPQGMAAGTPVTLGIRPEHMRIAAGEGALHLAATVELVERLGETGFAHLRLASGTVAIAEIRGDTGLKTGDRTHVALDAAHLHLFGADGRRLG